MPPNRPLPVVLSIAGSDSAGLAGIQADLKTFAARGVHGVAAITAITAQHSREIRSVRILSPAAVVAQLDALSADFAIAAVKIGMLGNAGNIRGVTAWLRAHHMGNVVVDPVLASSSGCRLLSSSAIKVLRDELLPLSTIVTPNVLEAEALLQRRLTSAADMRHGVAELRESGARAVLLKGGHFDEHAGSVLDYLADERGISEFKHTRFGYAARGTGCTLASAIAAGLAKKNPLRRAVGEAEDYLHECYRRALPVGNGDARALVHA